jgi:methyltransferase (TIGR00027 family)
VVEPDEPPAPISRTCIYTAAGRALGARDPDASVRNPDYLAEQLLGDPSSLDLDHPAVRALDSDYVEAMKDVEVVSVVRMMMIRTKFVDDALRRAVESGATQVVILGAGFDSHAYRFEALLDGVRVFEVDRPATQAMKRQRVREVLGAAPPNLTYASIDFQREDLRDVLARHGHDLQQRTFFVLEGVTMYLPEDAVRDTLRFVALHPAGSSIVFDFVYRAMVDMIAAIDVAKTPAAWQGPLRNFLSLTRDEPWVFGLPGGGEREYLADLGLELRESFTIGGEESLARYTTRADGTQVGAETIAAAMERVRERARAAGRSIPDPASPQMRDQQRLMSYQFAEAVVSG